MATTTQQPEHVQLALEGTTCASCAARIERSLNELAGVEATVNDATEQASHELLAAVKRFAKRA